MENVKLHDTVMVTLERIDREKYYYDRKVCGVVVLLSDKVLSVKISSGKTEEINLQDEEYNTTISQYSEVEFSNDIQKSVDTLSAAADEMIDKYNAALDWKKQFKFEISLLGRLATFIRRNGI